MESLEEEVLHLNKVHRQADRPGFIVDPSDDSLPHPPGRIGAETVPLVGSKRPTAEISPVFSIALLGYQSILRETNPLAHLSFCGNFRL